MSNSNSNSNTNSNPQNSASNSSRASPSPSLYAEVDIYRYSRHDAESRPRISRQTRSRDGSTYPSPLELTSSNGGLQPLAPAVVYIVTSNFTSQTTTYGVRLSESDIVGFQILGVFARIEDANQYAEHECEEIDAGVRRRRSNGVQGGPVGIQEGEGIRVEAIVRDDGTVSWSVEDVGHIEVGRWPIQ